MISAETALERLIAGNQRFVAGLSDNSIDYHRRHELVDGQEPFAIILGCADSRVPIELVFDQGLGDLFVIRVAGNVVAPSLIGSVEYAAVHCGSPLVVVMGHTHCGAVAATLSELQKPSENQSPNLRSIVERIRPSVASLLQTELVNDPVALKQEAVRANVRMSVAQLFSSSVILEKMVLEGTLKIVGAEYSLETGAVDFFEGV